MLSTISLRNAILAILVFFLFACKKDQEITIIPAQPFATAGTNQNDVEKFRVTLNADSLKQGQSGKWTIEKGLIEAPLVYFSDDTKPNSAFNGMPGETYSLKWTVNSPTGKPSESVVKVSFKPLIAKIENLSPDNQTKFYLNGTEYRRGLWTIEGKYAFILNQTLGGTYVESINAPYVEFQGYANTPYKLTWTTWYGSKSASTTIEINTGNYLETEALDDLQLSTNSNRVVIENGHVTKLMLNASGIAWIFEDIVHFPALQGLTYLKYLDMSGSSAHTIAPVIGDKFRALEYLNVDGAPISSISDNIGNLKNLKKLIISHPNYGERISFLPESFGNLESLEYFDAKACGLQYLPESFGKLKKLKHLECYLNPMQELPSSIGNLESLEVMWANSTEMLPSSISKLSKLRKLYFVTTAGNPKLPADFGKLSSLDTLTLEGKYAELPASFTDLNLKSLQLSFTNISQWPENFGKLKNLERLQLAGPYKLLPESITLLSKLKYLTINSNLLERLPNDLGNLKNVTFLSAESTKIRELPSSIGGMESLTELRVNNNLIESLPSGFFDLPKLSTLSISNNQLSMIQDDFSKLSSTLKTLNIYGNKITAADVAKLKKLLPTTGISSNFY